MRRAPRLAVVDMFSRAIVLSLLPALVIGKLKDYTRLPKTGCTNTLISSSNSSVPSGIPTNAYPSVFNQLCSKCDTERSRLDSA